MELKYEKKDVYSSLGEKEKLEVYKFTDSYLKFLNAGKTEYLCVEEALKMLKK